MPNKRSLSDEKSVKQITNMLKNIGQNILTDPVLGQNSDVSTPKKRRVESGIVDLTGSGNEDSSPGTSGSRSVRLTKSHSTPRPGAKRPTTNPPKPSSLISLKNAQRPSVLDQARDALYNSKFSLAVAKAKNQHRPSTTDLLNQIKHMKGELENYEKLKIEHACLKRKYEYLLLDEGKQAGNQRPIIFNPTIVNTNNITQSHNNGWVFTSDASPAKNSQPTPPKIQPVTNSTTKKTPSAIKWKPPSLKPKTIPDVITYADFNFNYTPIQTASLNLTDKNICQKIVVNRIHKKLDAHLEIDLNCMNQPAMILKNFPGPNRKKNEFIFSDIACFINDTLSKTRFVFEKKHVIQLRNKLPENIKNHFMKMPKTPKFDSSSNPNKPSNKLKIPVKFDIIEVNLQVLNLYKKENLFSFPNYEQNMTNLENLLEFAKNMTNFSRQDEGKFIHLRFEMGDKVMENSMKVNIPNFFKFPMNYFSKSLNEAVEIENNWDAVFGKDKH